MNSRERTFLALQHKAGDRIPIDFWATDAVMQRLARHCGGTYTDFLDRYEVDLRYIDGPQYIGPPLPPETDIWGVRRTSVSAGGRAALESYEEVIEPPLSRCRTVHEVENYNWPDADMFDYSVITAQCEAVLRQDRVVVFMGDRLNRVAQFKPAMYLRGTEQIFMDLVAEPEIADAIFRKIREFYLSYLERLLNAAGGMIDIVLTGDDFGAQNGLLISAAMWRKFLKPGFAEYIDLVHAYGSQVMHHTCGSVARIIPDLIECNLDVLQSIQPEAEGMTLAELKRICTDRLCLQGGISIQKIMPYGTPDEVRQTVKDIAETIKPEAGYIFCTSHNLQADTPTENIVALMQAYLDYGRYD